jgi:hypothetical protein
MIPWQAFYKFAFVDWVVVEDTAFVLLLILMWKLYKSIRRIEERLKEMDDSLDHVEWEVARRADRHRVRGQAARRHLRG